MKSSGEISKSFLLDKHNKTYNNNTYLGEDLWTITFINGNLVSVSMVCQGGHIASNPLQEILEANMLIEKNFFVCSFIMMMSLTNLSNLHIGHTTCTV